MPSFNRNYTKASGQTYKGRHYHSGKEAQYAMYLDQLVSEGKIESWEPQVKIELCGENGGKVCNYYVDFAAHHKDGTTEFIEVKGFVTDVWQLKWKLFNDKYGKDCKYKITLEKV